MVVLVVVVHNDCRSHFTENVAQCVLRYIVNILGITVITCVALESLNYNYILCN